MKLCLVVSFLFLINTRVGLCSDVLLFQKPPFPKKFSEWNIFLKKDGKFSLNERVIYYEPVNKLFTDYAVKYRTLWIPKNKKVIYEEDGSLTFPLGSVLTKTFSYPKDKIIFSSQGLAVKKTLTPNNYFDALDLFNDLYLVETRVLVKTSKKWYSLPYVWDRDQGDAKLSVIGGSLKLKLAHDEIGETEFNYLIPNMNQCISCHMETKDFQKTFKPIAVKLARNLNKESLYGGTSKNQLQELKDQDMILGLPPLSQIEKIVSWDDHSLSLEKRSRAYLDVNCAHCHNLKGSANTSGLYLNYDNYDSTSYGVCKQPIAAGNGSEHGSYDISPSDPLDSVLYLRMKSTNPSVMMPELGRSLIHRKGIELIYQWIAGMDGSCNIED